MTANPSHLGALPYADEASWGDQTTVVFDERLPISNSVNNMVSGLTQDKIPAELTHLYQNDGNQEVVGPYGGSFPVSGFLTGHGSTTAGAITATDTPTFLGRCVGNSTTDQAGTTVNVATDEGQFSLVGGTVSAGGLIGVGAIGDDKGNGQLVAVDNASTITLLTDTDAAVEAGDVIGACELVHPNEAPASATVASMRFNMQTANMRINTFGTFCTGLEFSGLNAGEVPTYTATMMPSSWLVENAATFPTTTAVDAFVPPVVAAGSFFMGVVGAQTRTKYCIRDFQLSIDLQVTPHNGPCTSDAKQVVNGATRTRCQASFSFVVDSEASGTDTMGGFFTAASPNYYHVLYTLSAVDGSRVGFYFPKCKIVGSRPTQHDMDGVNRKTVQMMALTGPTVTTALTQSNWRLGIG